VARAPINLVPLAWVREVSHETFTAALPSGTNIIAAGSPATGTITSTFVLPPVVEAPHD